MSRFFLLALLFVSLVFPPLAHSGPRTLRIAAMVWEPYTSPTLQNDGFYAEIVKEAFARTGYTVELKFYPWKRGLLLVRDGTIDGLIGAGYTQERALFMAYPRFAWESYFHFFHMGDGPKTVKDFSELCPAKLGQLRGTRVTQLVTQKAPCIEVEFVDSILTNLDKLVYGRVKFIINTPETMRHIMRTYHPDKIDLLKRVEPPLEKVSIYTVFSKSVPDWSEVAEAFDKGIESLKEDGSFKAILTKHGVQQVR